MTSKEPPLVVIGQGTSRREYTPTLKRRWKCDSYRFHPRYPAAEGEPRSRLARFWSWLKDFLFGEAPPRSW